MGLLNKNTDKTTPDVNSSQLTTQRELTISDVQSLATAKVSEDAFVVYLVDYISRLSTIIAQVQQMKATEKPLKQRLNQAQKLLNSLLKQEVTVHENQVSDVSNIVDVSSEVINNITQETDSLLTNTMIEELINPEFRHTS